MASDCTSEDMDDKKGAAIAKTLQTLLINGDVPLSMAMVLLDIYLPRFVTLLGDITIEDWPLKGIPNPHVEP